MYRLLRQEEQLAHRRSERVAKSAAARAPCPRPDPIRCSMARPPSWPASCYRASVRARASARAFMQRFGVPHTRSRRSVSNDNLYVESTFRTLKYRPQLPRQWAHVDTVHINPETVQQTKDPEHT